MGNLLGFYDWLVVAVVLLASVGIGLLAGKNSGKSLTSFFLGGRNMPWYLAGVSMVATTFAADTPLAVTELVAQSGISGNWLWWNAMIGGLFTTFFFAKLWRRAGILTDLELLSIRYAGAPARFLRLFRAGYFGLLLNAIIIGWVNLAMMTIIEIFLEVPKHQLIYVVMGLMALALTYSALAGLKGVIFTDFFQFFLAMGGTIALAIIFVNHPDVGGLDALKAKLPAAKLQFWPQIGNGNIASGLSIGLGSFFAFIAIQWWASWYPGAEPGGGGYIAQRMMSCKNEQHALWATLFFQVMHYCVRPWPWIITALGVLIVFPDLSDPKTGYVLAMKNYLPAGLKGLLLASFFAAYLSTISTQLNWGVSYIMNDLIKPLQQNRATPKHNHDILFSRIATVLIAILATYITTLLSSVAQAWSFIIQAGAGLGLVLILRWFWWRINSYSEIVATIAPFLAYGFIYFVLAPTNPTWLEPVFINPKGFYATVGFTTLSWLVATFVTKPEPTALLQSFYRRTTPGGWWAPIAGANDFTFIKTGLPLWIAGVLFTVSLLVAIGSLLIGTPSQTAIWFALATVSGVFLYIRVIKKAPKEEII